MALPAGRKGIKASLVKSDGTLVGGGGGSGGGGGGTTIVPVNFTPATNIEVIKNDSVLIGETVYVSLLLKATGSISQYADLGLFEKVAKCTSMINLTKDAIGSIPNNSNVVVERPGASSSYPNGRCYTAGTASENDTMYVKGSYMIKED